MVTRHDLSEEQDILPEDTEVTEKLPDAFKTLSETSYHTLTTREWRPVRNVQILEAEYIENEETITPPHTDTTTRKNHNFKLEAFVSRPDDEVRDISLCHYHPNSLWTCDFVDPVLVIIDRYFKFIQDLIFSYFPILHTFMMNLFSVEFSFILKIGKWNSVKACFG